MLEAELPPGPSAVCRINYILSPTTALIRVLYETLKLNFEALEKYRDFKKGDYRLEGGRVLKMCREVKFSIYPVTSAC
jgi:hypothetical protein